MKKVSCLLDTFCSYCGKTCPVEGGSHLECLPQRVTSLNEKVVTATHNKMSPFRQDIAFNVLRRFCLLEVIKVADNQDRHKLSDEFEQWL